MLGAIVGDVIGSVYERTPIKTIEFPLFASHCRFTDDTVLTLAIAECLLTDEDYVDAFHRYWSLYPNCGFGGSFYDWARHGIREPYGSFGNGSAMRVSPVAWAFDTLEEVLDEAARSAAVTHNHPEGIRGARGIAMAVFLARTGETKDTIRREIERELDYDLSVPLDQIRPTYRFDVTCQGSVPPAIRAFLESTSFEDAVRKAISIGGDSDTLACMAGSIAHACYGPLPTAVAQPALDHLDQHLLTTADDFAFTHDIPWVAE